MKRFDVAVLGAGAAGMMCASEAGRRGRSVVVLEHAAAPGEKIRISGGGRCNFTNLNASPAQFLSANPSFCISALSRYRPTDFVAMVQRHGIAFHEKTLGQLFCDGSSRQIVSMLTREMTEVGVELRLGVELGAVDQIGSGFRIATNAGGVECASLVVATGGKSVPKMGATGIGYAIAAQFGLRVAETRAGLVPLTFEVGALERMKPLVGVAVDVVVACGKTSFREAMLFTHRGLSGPAILQISSYWREGDELVVTLAPGSDVFTALRKARIDNPKQSLQSALAVLLPRALAQFIAAGHHYDRPVGAIGDAQFRDVAASIQAWRLKPVGSEGYRTAEVTLGGVDTDDLDSRTMAAKSVQGLYFIGEVVDVTGWLGGYNFQWAWASGWCAGQVA